MSVRCCLTLFYATTFRKIISSEITLFGVKTFVIPFSQLYESLANTHNRLTYTHLANLVSSEG